MSSLNRMIKISESKKASPIYLVPDARLNDDGTAIRGVRVAAWKEIRR